MTLLSFRTLWAIGSALTGAAALPAQSPVDSGARVRLTLTAPYVGAGVHAGSRRITGEVMRSTPDLILLGSDRDQVGTPFLRSSIDRLEIGRGRRTRTGRGAFLGFLVGVGVGTVTGVVVCRSSTECHDNQSDVFFLGNDNTALVAVALGLGGGLLGTGVGAIVGSFIRTDRWVLVPLIGSGGAGSGSRGIQLGITLRPS